jgi:hypothetical protein
MVICASWNNGGASIPASRGSSSSSFSFSIWFMVPMNWHSEK